MTFVARLQVDGRSGLSWRIRSCLWSFRCQSYRPSSVCRLAGRASNKLPRTRRRSASLHQDAAVRPCIRRHYACMCAWTTLDCVKCKQAAYARPVSSIIGLITCKQSVYPVIMNLAARRWLMNSAAQTARIDSSSFAHLPGLCSFLSGGLSRFLAWAIHLHPGNRLPCLLLLNWEFIGIDLNR